MYIFYYGYFLNELDEHHICVNFTYKFNEEVFVEWIHCVFNSYYAKNGCKCIEQVTGGSITDENICELFLNAMKFEKTAIDAVYDYCYTMHIKVN